MAEWWHTDLSQIAGAPLCGTGVADFSRPAGCVTSDRVNTILYTGRDGHIHRLRQGNGDWAHTDVSLAAGAPARALTSPAVCIRPDGTCAVMYGAQGNRLHELRLADATAAHADPTALAGAPPLTPVGPPTHLVRGDGVVAAVYTGTDGHIHQLALVAGRWEHSDLSALTQSTAHSLVRTTGYVRSDRTTSVIYVGTPLMELALPPNGRWTLTDLSSLVSAPAALLLRWPAGFVRADGIASVVYVAEDQLVHELSLVDGRWQAAALSETAGAPKAFDKGVLMGYVRGDGVTAVVYRGIDSHVHELALTGGRWQQTDLSAAAGTPTGGFPFGYVRADGSSGIVYAADDGSLHHLTSTAA
jgi:hypothetical protein